MNRMRQHGFTFVEMVVAITIAVIVICFATALTSAPVDSYFAQTRRVDLEVSGNTFADKIQYDIEHALPNSVRVRNVGTRAIVEMLAVEAISFYAPNGSGGDPAREVDFAPTSDTQFYSVGLMFPVTQPRPILLNGYYLVVGNTGVAPQDAYLVNSGSRTPPGTTITFATSLNTGEDKITIAPGFGFAATVSTKMYLVSGPVSYVCNYNANSRTIWRFSKYAIRPNIPASELIGRLNAAGVVKATVSKDAAACKFTCEDPSLANCKTLLTTDVSISRATSNGPESLRIFRSLPIDSKP